MSGTLTVSFFLINTLFSLIIFFLWAHLLLRYFNISALHPIAQNIFSFTYQVINPVTTFIYRKKQPPPRYDLVALGFLIVVEIIKFWLLGLIAYYMLIPLSYLIVLVMADLIIQPCDLLFYALIIRAIMSWVNPHWCYHPAATLINQLTEPLLAFCRRFIPLSSSIDFSPYIALVVLKMLTLFIKASMPLRLL